MRIGGFIRGPRFLRGGLWEEKVVLWCETCLLRKDKWSKCLICRVRCFFFPISRLHSRINSLKKHISGMELILRCKRLLAGVFVHSTVCLSKDWIGFFFFCFIVAWKRSDNRRKFNCGVDGAEYFTHIVDL